MNSFTFANPTKVYFGKNQLGHLGEEVSRFGKKVLLAYGGGSIKRIGLYDRVIDQLSAAGMTVFELSGVEPNPHHTTIMSMCRFSDEYFEVRSASVGIPNSRGSIPSRTARR